MTIEKLISAKEVAEILGLSEKTIKAKHKRLGLPHYKIASLIKYRASEIEDWLQNRHIDKNTTMPRVVRQIKI